MNERAALCSVSCEVTLVVGMHLRVYTVSADNSYRPVWALKSILPTDPILFF